MATTYLALLRGINVGGKNKLPMKVLTEMFVQAGCENVATYIQSGNVLFDADPDVSARLPDLMTAQIADRFGYRIPLMLRTSEHLKAVIDNNPFLATGAAHDALHVLFLADPPSRGQIAGLDPDRSPPDAFLVRGSEVYLHLPQGMARTKLTNTYFDAKLTTISTGRNWRTVTRLLALMETREPQTPHPESAS